MIKEHEHPIWFTKQEMLALAIWLGPSHKYTPEELEEINGVDKDACASKIHLKYSEFEQHDHK